MDRLWNWHKNGSQLDNIDMFIEDLRVANQNKSDRNILTEQEIIKKGDIVKSTSFLLAIAKQQPQLTQKVVKAAVEMNMFIRNYYGRSKHELLNAEKMALPAMLAALESQIKENVSDSSLRTKASILVSNAQRDVKNPETPQFQCDAYANFVQAYKDELHRKEVNPQQRKTERAEMSPNDTLRLKKVSRKIYEI